MFGQKKTQPDDELQDQVRQLQVDNTELNAALGVMLASWEAASGKLVAFMKNSNKETAEEYEKTFQGLFEASVAARVIHFRQRKYKKSAD